MDVGEANQFVNRIWLFRAPLRLLLLWSRKLKPELSNKNEQSKIKIKNKKRITFYWIWTLAKPLNLWVDIVFFTPLAITTIFVVEEIEIIIIEKIQDRKINDKKGNMLLHADFGEAIQFIRRVRFFPPPPGDYYCYCVRKDRNQIYSEK